MNDYNEIFGYQVYKPPPEKNMPIIPDLNCPGEVITLIDPNADVIKDPAVQKIFKSLDGERTVKIEDLPPDVRYDGWNRKAQYDRQIISRAQQAAAAAAAASGSTLSTAATSAAASSSKTSLQPQPPVVNQNLLKENEGSSSQHYKQEALRQAQLKALTAKNEDLEFNRQLQETKMALEKEIHRQLVEQLTLRAQKKSVTPEQQALIEKLYLDLRLINPELAFATLKASASLNESSPVGESTQTAVEVAQPQHHHRHHQHNHQQSQPPEQQHSPQTAHQIIAPVPTKTAAASTTAPAQKSPAAASSSSSATNTAHHQSSEQHHHNHHNNHHNHHHHQQQHQHHNQQHHQHQQNPQQHHVNVVKARQTRPVPAQMVHSQGSILTEAQARNVTRQTRVKPPPQI